MARMAAIVGLAGIDKAIKQIAGIGDNLNERIQAVAVAIVDHAANAGNGDMSRALKLVQTTKRFRSLNTSFLVGWFRYFASTNVNLNADDGAGKVSLIKRDNKAYRGFDVAGAKANNWFEAIDADGNRAPWYQGPVPENYEPQNIGGFADSLRRTVKRLETQLTGTVKVGGKEVERYALSDEDLRQAHAALETINVIANTLARREEIRELTEQLAEKQANVDTDPGATILATMAQDNEAEEPKGRKAVG